MPAKVTISTAEAEGLDPEGGKWVVICEEHSAILNVDTRAAARSVTSGEEFCDCCRGVVCYECNGYDGDHYETCPTLTATEGGSR